jgi:4-hydroxybenzoate polyprenyltransferase
MSWETLYLCGVSITTDATAMFVFFATFFIYNFHAFANYLVKDSFSSFFHLLDNRVSVIQRLCVVTGFAGTVITFLFISTSGKMICLLLGILTLSYTLPIFKIKGKQTRLREISYIKILTISLTWALVTVVLPIMNNQHQIPASLYFLVFFERVLFVYAITLPFEIRDMEQEMRFGVRTIPAIHGIENSKRLGYLLLIIFSLLSLLHNYYYSHDRNIATPLILSAITAGVLIYFTNEKRNQWYYKGWIDGTMFFQFLFVILFNL